MQGIQGSSPESTANITSTIDIMLDIYRDKIVIHLRDNNKDSAFAKEPQTAIKETSSFDLTCSQAIGFNNYSLTFLTIIDADPLRALKGN